MSATFRQRIVRHRQLSLTAHLLRMFTLALVASGVPITLFAWLDRTLVFSSPWRWMAFIVTAGALLVALLAGIHRFPRAVRHSITAAMDAHSALPSGYVISTSAQLAGTTVADPTEHALHRRLHADAEKLAATARPLHPWPGRYLLGTVAALIVLTALLQHLEGLHALHRMVAPWSPMPYTHVTLRSITGHPARREPFDLHGFVEGRVPDHARVRLDNGQPFQVPIEPDGTFVLPFREGLADPAIATALAGADGVSRPVAIELRATPVRTGYAHRIDPPAYTGHEQRTETRPSFALLRGSTLHFSVSFDLAPQTVRMVFDTDRPPLDLHAADDDPLTWHADLQPIARTFGYRLEVRDADGRYPVEDHPQQIVVIPDTPPTIEIAKHNAGQLEGPEDTLLIDYVAQDDIGLASVHAHYYRVGHPQQRTALVPAFDPMTLNHEGQWQLSLRHLQVQPLDMVVVILEARDRNDFTGPGITMSEPLIIEVPEIETFLPDDDGDEGGDGGDSSIEEINPLLLQRQLYRDTLRTSLRLSTPPIEDLGRRQTEIHEHIVAMQHSPLAEHLGHEFTALLRRAAQQALGAERMLSAGRAGRGGERRTAQTVNASLNHQGRVIRLLLEAARIQREHAAEEGETDAGMEGDEGGEEIVYTLISDPTPPADSETNEEEEHERIARALLAIQEALEQQQQLNQEIEDASEHEAGSAPPPETADEQGEQGEGERTEGDATASDARGEPGGEGPAHTGPTQSFAERQLALQELSQRIERQIEQVRPPESGADPQLAAEQMRQAAAFQREAAEAILRGALEEAASEGAGAEDALQRAMVFTESLLGRDIRFRIEAQSHAPGYQNLIRDYSRRLSYDQ